MTLPQRMRTQFMMLAYPSSRGKKNPKIKPHNNRNYIFHGTLLPLKRLPCPTTQEPLWQSHPLLPINRLGREGRSDGNHQCLFTDLQSSSVSVGTTANNPNSITPKDSSFQSTMKLISLKRKGGEHHRCLSH